MTKVKNLGNTDYHSELTVMKIDGTKNLQLTESVSVLTINMVSLLRFEIFL